MAQLFVVFDVESIGLHGEGFAFGAVVINQDGEELDATSAACSPDMAAGASKDREWVAQNVPPLAAFCLTPFRVRHLFWVFWRRWADQGALLAADVPWPVEARLLAQCVDDARDHSRDWEGPYPLIDIASVRFAAGLDPLGTEERLDSELPVHNPLADARQSARLLIEAVRRIDVNPKDDLEAAVPVAAGDERRGDEHEG